MEIYDEDGSFAGELVYTTPLPRRFTMAMKRLAGVSRGRFTPIALSIDIPVAMLKTPPAPLD